MGARRTLTIFTLAATFTVLAASIVSAGPAAAGNASSAPATRRTARTAEPLPVYATRGDKTPVVTLPPTTEFGTTRVVLVTKRKGQWLKVLLPERPNGSTGWVRAADVEVRIIHDELVVDLASRTLTWRRNGQVVLESPVAVGAPDTPTPAGRFYVTDLLDTPDGGGYGPFAVGVSAHSETLSEFAGSDGQIGVHGTSDPGSIGQAVSHGCVRLPNDVITRLATELPLGTPITIR